MKIGVLGGGQLARMIALAGVPLGYSFVVLDPSSEACATEAADLIQGDYDDVAALDKLSVVLVALLAWLVLGESLGLRVWLGVVFMAIGATLVAWA